MSIFLSWLMESKPNFFSKDLSNAEIILDLAKKLSSGLEERREILGCCQPKPKEIFFFNQKNFISKFFYKFRK